MNAIQVMLEALKSTRPSRQHCTSNEQWDAAMDFHDQAIALGAAELRREPDAWLWIPTQGSGTEQVRKDEPVRGCLWAAALYTREEVK